jgi:predicted Zn-dependent peptidase
MNLITNCGSAFDPNGKHGLANLFSMMIDEGAGSYNSLELSEEFDILGCSFSAACNHDHVFLSLRTLTENFERALELFSLIVTQPHLKDSDFLRERRKVEVKLLQQKDDSEELAALAFDHLIHGKNNPYAFPTLGYESTISDLNISDLRDYYNNSFSSENSNLVIAGNIEIEELTGLLEKYLGNWKNKAVISSPPFNSIKNSRAVYIMHKEGAVQTEIRTGHQSTIRKTADYYAKTIMNMILGGQFTSRINLNLREAKGFTYGANSYFSYFKNSGDFCVATSVSTESTRAAVNEILLELERIKEGVTPEELQFAKTSLIRKFPSQFESDNQIISNLSSLVIYELPYDYFNHYIDNISGVNINEVNEAAVNNLKLDELSVVLVGDQRKLIEAFSSFEPGFVKIINQNGEPIEQ